MPKFVRKIRIHRPAEEVFAWHERPDALRRLTPPWVRLTAVSSTGGIRDGAEVELVQKIGPFRGRWKVRHEDYVAGKSFADRQISGPFREWKHVHSFERLGDGSCELTDSIVYELPFGRAGKVGDAFVRRELDRLFRYRHTVTKMDLETHPLPKTDRPWKIAITGATGLVGSHLTALLRTAGHEVRAISRGDQADIRWNPETGFIDSGKLRGIDAVVHLAGEPIAQRWTTAARKRILGSRREGTRLLAETVLSLDSRPPVFVVASGINAYGAVRSGPVTETSEGGTGFLADVCREWENASEILENAGIRRVVLRIGMVLSPAGGALQKLLPVFRAGLGGPIGRGERWMSWIAIDDLAALFAHAIFDERYRGILNAVAPEPVRNKDFTRSLAKAVRRPAFAAVPPPVLRIALGQMAEETLLGDLQVKPAKLQELGYRFRFGKLEEAWRHLLGTRKIET